jgi:hypothetical protein
MRRYARWYVAVILHFGPWEMLKSTRSPRLSTIFCILAPSPEWRPRQPMALSHAAATGTGAVATAAEASHGGNRRSPTERCYHHGSIHGARRRRHGPSALPPPFPPDLKRWSPRARGCLLELGLPGLFFELRRRLPPSLQRCHALAITGPCPCVGQGPASKRH